MSSIVPAYVESKTAHLLPLIDADSLVYRAGFSGVERDEEGKPQHTPLAHSLSNLRTIMDSILDKFPRREGEHVFLTPSGGFRYKVAKIRPYKGTRTSHKPEHFTAMREYLQKKYGAIVVDEDLPEDQRREADDFCGMYQWAKPDKSTCVVSGDKDLKQIPGWLYNPQKDTFEMRTLRDADLFFWYQMCVGDSVDNVAGLKGMGPKKTEGLLESCSRKPVRVMKAVAALYKKEFSGRWKDALDENAQLLFIHRQEGKDWKEYFGGVHDL
jgi:DNA polymerase-1